MEFKEDRVYTSAASGEESRVSFNTLRNNSYHRRNSQISEEKVRVITKDTKVKVKVGKKEVIVKLDKKSIN